MPNGTRLKVRKGLQRCSNPHFPHENAHRQCRSAFFKSEMLHRQCRSRLSKSEMPNRQCRSAFFKSEMPHRQCRSALFKSEMPNRQCRSRLSKSEMPNRQCRLALFKSGCPIDSVDRRFSSLKSRIDSVGWCSPKKEDPHIGMICGPCGYFRSDPSRPRPNLKRRLITSRLALVEAILVRLPVRLLSFSRWRWRSRRSRSTRSARSRRSCSFC